MNAATLGSSLARRLSVAGDTALVIGLFTVALFLSALLLFSVQPMFARMVLPKLGGSPSVWAVSMCFFQGMLLLGYCYAHVLNRFVAPRYAPAVQLTVLAAALLALPVGLPADAAAPPAGDAYLWLLGMLGIGVGLPFFAVSANAPLLQAWFARSGHPHARDPYFLYGASNLGSLVALLAYPILIEPFAGLGQQASLWASGFFLLGLLIAGCGLAVIAMPSNAAGPAVAGVANPASERTAWRQRCAWLGLSFVPSGLLVAFTSYVTTDIASAPFLWVIPLALFLATFILVFRKRPVLSHQWLLLLQPALVGGVLFGLATPGNKGWTIACIAGAGAFFVTTMVAHRELYEQRPAPAHLTEFYLWMSLGGVLGGAFAALVAPQIFTAIWEFPLLLVLGMACRPGVFGARPAAREVRDLAAVAIGALIAMLAIAGAMHAGHMDPITLPRILFIVGFGAWTLLSVDNPLRQLVFVALMMATVAILPSAMNRGDAERSFFGVHRVTLTADRQMRLLMHGTTIHGAERIVDAGGRKLSQPLPATYYYPGGPMAQGVTVARTLSGKAGGGLRVGVVGLGAGSMACYSRPGEQWRLYEIDPVVVRIARDPHRFTFLARCLPNADIVVGDARLTLTSEPAGAFDYLVIDAFSSDSVPVHLLTVEALRLYLDKLAPDGVLAMHVSNRHLDLVSVAAAVVKAVPGTRAALADDRVADKGFDAAASHVVFIARSQAAIAAVHQLPYVDALPDTGMRAWTDDYSNVLAAIWRKYR